MKTDYTIGKKVYAVVGLSVMTAIIVGYTRKAIITNITNELSEDKFEIEWLVSEIKENGDVSPYPYPVSTDNIFTDITKAAAVVGTKAMKL